MFHTKQNYYFYITLHHIEQSYFQDTILTVLQLQLCIIYIYIKNPCFQLVFFNLTNSQIVIFSHSWKYFITIRNLIKKKNISHKTELPFLYYIIFMESYLYMYVYVYIYILKNPCFFAFNLTSSQIIIIFSIWKYFTIRIKLQL